MISPAPLPTSGPAYDAAVARARTPYIIQRSKKKYKETAAEVLARLEREQEALSLIDPEERTSNAYEYIDFILNGLYREGVREGLRTFVYHAMHFWRFRCFPMIWTGPYRNVTGIDRNVVHDVALSKLTDIWIEICAFPGFDTDKRVVTIFDYPTHANPGESFARFVKRRFWNRRTEMKKKKDGPSFIHFEETLEGRARYGGISEGQAIKELAVPEEEPVYSGSIDRELKSRLDVEQQAYNQRYPEIAHAVLVMNVNSASEVARLIKNGELEHTREGGRLPKSPRDRERVRQIMTSFRSRMRAVVEQFVRDKQRQIRAGLLRPEQACDLSNPEILNHEVMRVLGGFAKAPKSGPNYAPNGRLLIPESDGLGWSDYRPKGGSWNVDFGPDEDEHAA